MEIYCDAGKRMVDLPDEAFHQDLLHPKRVNIPVCKDCQHSGHLKRLEFIENNIKAAAAIGNKLEPIKTHEVSVFDSSVPNYNGKVMCTCNCGVKSVKTK